MKNKSDGLNAWYKSKTYDVDENVSDFKIARFNTTYHEVSEVSNLRIEKHPHNYPMAAILEWHQNHRYVNSFIKI